MASFQYLLHDYLLPDQDTMEELQVFDEAFAAETLMARQHMSVLPLSMQEI